MNIKNPLSDVKFREVSEHILKTIAINVDNSLKLMSAIITTATTSTQPFQGGTPETGEKLIKQLLECVQECQKRYGGKTELATEFDSCVAGLCITFEAVLHHGLRPKPLESIALPNSASALKQVSDIVVNTLYVSTENPSFWPFIKKHLTKHEQERYDDLKHIWTDTGRCRAWLRSALNERSLERYCQALVNNTNLLKNHYEDWAILRDQEKNSLLPVMAAGLGSILFAISIDKPELNSGVAHRPDSLKTKIEPIIEAPIVENKPKEKKKRKVARQFISFDDDDCSALSTSLPSSSSSVSSETNSIGETKTSLKKIMEENKNYSPEQHVKRQLSIENSGSREKFSTEVPETLTPVSHSEIGELTPVSVEIDKNFDSPDTSDDILEVPTDISAVLTAVESKNREEIQKKQERIDNLLKENESLKEQIKKYVGAIQMLKNNDDDDDVHDALENLQIGQKQPDYKCEAKLFEQKLVQVAEMHAELMDFNVRLQHSLSQKETVLDRLKKELEELRGPMPTDDVVSEDSRGNVNVWIPSAFLTGSGSSSHHVYQVFLRAGNDEWNIYRRYAQFHALHTDLKKLDPEVATFDFPPKKSIGKKDSALVEARRKRLQIYLRRVLGHWPELSHCNSRFLLEQHLAFFKDQKDESKNKKSVLSPRRYGQENHYTGL